MNALSQTDPKGLIREAFAIQGISPGECRSIFLDWALSLPRELEPLAAVQALIARYEAEVPDDHPMLAVLREALQSPPKARRRGGRQARIKD